MVFCMQIFAHSPALDSHRSVCTCGGKVLVWARIMCLWVSALSERVHRVTVCEGAFERGLCVTRGGHWHCAGPHYPTINTLNDPQADSKEMLESAWSEHYCVNSPKNKRAPEPLLADAWSITFSMSYCRQTVLFLLSFCLILKTFGLDQRQFKVQRHSWDFISEKLCGKKLWISKSVKKQLLGQCPDLRCRLSFVVSAGTFCTDCRDTGHWTLNFWHLTHRCPIQPLF